MESGVTWTTKKSFIGKINLYFSTQKNLEIFLQKISKNFIENKNLEKIREKQKRISQKFLKIFYRKTTFIENEISKNFIFL